eukprot:5803234-Prymnesium_polylepis.1
MKAIIDGLGSRKAVGWRASGINRAIRSLPMHIHVRPGAVGRHMRKRNRPEPTKHAPAMPMA